MNHFVRYELRTTDVDAAQRFYSDLFGNDFWGNGIDVAPLPAAAAARGVPPYWLGHIGVEDVVGTALRFLSAGAMRLGGAGDIDAAGVALRDPFGANFALAPINDVRSRGSLDPPRDPTRVGWRLLSSRDEARGFEWYADVLGWTALDWHDLGPERGRHQVFTYDGSTEPVGSASDIARLPHVHPQWLYFFRTSDIDASLARVRALDGLPLRPARTPDGALMAACDDPQGGAFGLIQTA